MREIEFRGKLTNNRGWAFGNLNIHSDDCVIMTPDSTPLGRYGKVEPETVGQYTGKKDLNGIKIFEGDLVYFYNPNHDDEDGVMEVIFDNCEFAISGTGIYVSLSEIYSNQIEVIGNKFDNPELLE